MYKTIKLMFIILAIFISVMLASCADEKKIIREEINDNMESVNTTPESLNDGIPLLAEAYKDYFVIGSAITGYTMGTHKDIITTHLSSITPENDMKFEFIHPKKDGYDFYITDKMVKFAKENNMVVRGHTLIWHAQTPNWLFYNSKGGYVTREELLNSMEEHINTVMEHFKGDVYCWDVVNEAIDDGQEILKQTEWLEIIGEDYIEKAFEFAHKADPNALLFYNDYGAVEPVKREKIYNMLKGLIEKGVPIHGVGIQGHWGIDYPTTGNIKQAIEMYASLGLEVHITELDVTIYHWDEKENLYDTPPPELMERQAERYKELFDIFIKYKDNIGNVTFWGVADDKTWRDHMPVKGRKDWPLLFDENHNPKKAFFAIMDKN